MGSTPVWPLALWRSIFFFRFLFLSSLFSCAAARLVPTKMLCQRSVMPLWRRPFINPRQKQPFRWRSKRNGSLRRPVADTIFFPQCRDPRCAHMKRGGVCASPVLFFYFYTVGLADPSRSRRKTRTIAARAFAGRLLIPTSLVVPCRADRPLGFSSFLPTGRTGGRACGHAALAATFFFSDNDDDKKKRRNRALPFS